MFSGLSVVMLLSPGTSSVPPRAPWTARTRQCMRGAHTRTHDHLFRLNPTQAAAVDEGFAETSKEPAEEDDWLSQAAATPAATATGGAAGESDDPFASAFAAPRSAGSAAQSEDPFAAASSSAGASLKVCCDCCALPHAKCESYVSLRPICTPCLTKTRQTLSKLFV